MTSSPVVSAIAGRYGHAAQVSPDWRRRHTTPLLGTDECHVLAQWWITPHGADPETGRYSIVAVETSGEEFYALVASWVDTVAGLYARASLPPAMAVTVHSLIRLELATPREVPGRPVLVSPRDAAIAVVRQLAMSAVANDLDSPPREPAAQAAWAVVADVLCRQYRPRPSWLALMAPAF